VAWESVEATADDADTPGMTDVTRMALRRHFGDGDAILDYGVTPLLLSNVGNDVTAVPSRRDVSAGASLLDAMLYDAVSVSIHRIHR